MKIEVKKISVWFRNYPLARPFKISSGTLNSIPQIFIRAECIYGDKTIIGLGHNSYSLIWADNRNIPLSKKDPEFRKFIKKICLRLKGFKFSTPFDFYRAYVLQNNTGLPDLSYVMGLSLVDLALWDVYAKAKASGVWNLPIVHSYLDYRVPYPRSVMYLAGLDYPLTAVKKAVEKENVHAFKIKLKGDPIWDARRVSKVASVAGVKEITVDANESYASAGKLTLFIESLGPGARRALKFMEQPFSRHSKIKVKEISQIIPVFADESYAFHSDVPELKRLGYAGVSLKPHTKTFTGTLLALKELKKRKMKYSVMDLTTAPPIGYKVGAQTAKYLNTLVPPEANGIQYYRHWKEMKKKVAGKASRLGWGVEEETFTDFFRTSFAKRQRR